MTGTRGVEFAGLFVLMVALVGCGGGKHGTPATTTTTTTTAGTSTTSTTLAPRAQCAQLFAQDRAVRAAEAPIDDEYSAAVAVDPKSEEATRLNGERQQFQRELADIRGLIARIEAANGRAACPAK